MAPRSNSFFLFFFLIVEIKAVQEQNKTKIDETVMVASLCISILALNDQCCCYSLNEVFQSLSGRKIVKDDGNLLENLLGKIF